MTTRTAMRKLIAEQFPLPFVNGTTVSSSATTAVDIPVLGLYPDNFFIGAWFYFLNATVKDRRVTDSVQSTGALTLIPSDSGGTLDSYEVLPFSATAIHEALDEAIKDGYDRGWLVREMWLNHWLTGSPVYNSTFDYWTSSTALDGWSLDGGSLTRVSGVTNHVIPGEFAVTVPSGQILSLDAKYRRFLNDFNGASVNLWAVVKSGTASAIRAQIVEDGTVTASTAFNTSAGDDWELVQTSVERTIGEGVSELSIQINASGGDGECAAVWLTGGPQITNYPFPITLAPDGPDNIELVWVSLDQDDLVMRYQSSVGIQIQGRIVRYRDEQAATEIGMLRLDAPPPHQRRLWMPTSVPLSIPTADSDIIEVSTPEDILLAKMAARKLVEKQIARVSSADRERLGVHIGILDRDIADLSKGRGASGPTSLPLPMWLI